MIKSDTNYRNYYIKSLTTEWYFLYLSSQLLVQIIFGIFDGSWLFITRCAIFMFARLSCLKDLSLDCFTIPFNSQFLLLQTDYVTLHLIFSWFTLVLSTSKSFCFTVTLFSIFFTIPSEQRFYNYRLTTLSIEKMVGASTVSVKKIYTLHYSQLDMNNNNCFVCYSTVCTLCINNNNYWTIVMDIFKPRVLPSNALCLHIRLLEL